MKHLTTKSERKFQKVMHEFGQGTLKSHGEPVTDQRQALAIAYSEARKVYPNYGMMHEGGQAGYKYSIGDTVRVTTTQGSNTGKEGKIYKLSSYLKSVDYPNGIAAYKIHIESNPKNFQDHTFPEDELMLIKKGDKDLAVKGLFSLDAIEGKEFPGYTFGDDWNGFEVPYFERPSANRIMEALGGTYKDGKYLFDDGYGGEEEYPKQTINTVDGPKEVFAIGAYSWVWSSPEKKSFKFYFKDQPSFTLQADSEEAADEMYRTLTTEEAAALGINSELYEGVEPEKIEEVPGIMKEGGGITPSRAAELAKIYNEGTAKQLWTAWTPKNRNHFLLDHAIEFFELMGDNFDKSSNSYSILSYDTLPSPIRKSIIIHHAQGMYGQGGPIYAGGSGIPRFKFNIGDKVMVDDSGYAKKFEGFDLTKPATIRDRSKSKSGGKTYYFYKLEMANGDKPFNQAEQESLTLASMAGGGGVESPLQKLIGQLDDIRIDLEDEDEEILASVNGELEEAKTNEEAKKIIADNENYINKISDEKAIVQIKESFSQYKNAISPASIEEVDLFEQYDQLPKNVQKLIDEYNERNEKEDKYKLASKMQKKFNAIGYDFEWGLDGEAFNLKKISSPISMASGGEVYLDTHRRKYVLIDKRTQDPWANEFFATPEEAKSFAKQNKLKLIDKPELLQTGNFEFTSNKTLDDLIKSWSLGKGTTATNEKRLQKMLADAKTEKSRRASIKMNNGGPVPKKLSPAKKKLLDRINTLTEALASAGAAAQKSIQKKIDILQKQFDYNPSAKERAMANKGKFAMDVPVKYSKGIYKKLWNMNIKPRVLELKGIASIVVNSQLNLEKAYQIYSDMLKEKGEKVPALSKISRKL